MADTETKKDRYGGSSSQLYIGTPAGVVLCVDAVSHSDGASAKGINSGNLNSMDACLWHGYSNEPVKVNVPEHMLREMEKLFDLINYPRATTTPRSFADKNGGIDHSAPQRNGGFMPGDPSSVPRCIEDDELLEKRGNLSTFIIRVQQRQNSNWQGRITWVEKDRTLRFTTIMEMVRLIEKALEQ